MLTFSTLMTPKHVIIDQLHDFVYFKLKEIDEKRLPCVLEPVRLLRRNLDPDNSLLNLDCAVPMVFE